MPYAQGRITIVPRTGPFSASCALATTSWYQLAVSRVPGAERVVTPLELFFDLVYVFAIGQLSHHLLEHVDLRTGVETVILTLAVVYAWYMTAWGANWLEPDRRPV
jgi:low temperature requirement protein LtrA